MLETELLDLKTAQAIVRGLLDLFVGDQQFVDSKASRVSKAPAGSATFGNVQRFAIQFLYGEIARQIFMFGVIRFLALGTKSTNQAFQCLKLERRLLVELQQCFHWHK